jgi:hypothetical protein
VDKEKLSKLHETLTSAWILAISLRNENDGESSEMFRGMASQINELVCTVIDNIEKEESTHKGLKCTKCGK